MKSMSLEIGGKKKMNQKSQKQKWVNGKEMEGRNEKKKWKEEIKKEKGGKKWNRVRTERGRMKFKVDHKIINEIKEKDLRK